MSRTVGVAMVVIVVAGLLMLSQALVANAALAPPLSEFLNPQPAPANCLSCHVKKVEIHDILGSNNEACWTCHEGDYDVINDETGQHFTRLRLADETLLSLSDSTPLCAQCHQEHYDAWKERAPEIPGTADIAKCTDCHNPHQPQKILLDIAEPHPLVTPTPPPTTTTPPPMTTTPPLTTTTPPPTTTTPPPTTTTPPPTTTTPPPTTTPPDDGESSLNMGVIIGAVLGVLVVGGVVYYFVKK